MDLSMLIKGFIKSCPPQEVRPPEWDVSLVPCSLRKHPYEPFKKALNRDLIPKTLFLLALVSAKRVGELLGLSAQVHHSEGWRALTFSFIPNFVAKTQL